jgi:hypothetical protein
MFRKTFVLLWRSSCKQRLLFFNIQTRQDDIAKVKEFTNITDNGKIEKAIEACSNEKGVYDLSDVIDKLMENAGPYPNNKNVSITKC